MAELVPILAELAGGVTYAQPNAGQPRLEAGETVYAETPEHFAAVVSDVPGARRGHRRRLLRHAARLHRRARRGPGPLAAPAAAAPLTSGAVARPPVRRAVDSRRLL